MSADNNGVFSVSSSAIEFILVCGGAPSSPYFGIDTASSPPNVGMGIDSLYPLSLSLDYYYFPSHFFSVFQVSMILLNYSKRLGIAFFVFLWKSRFGCCWASGIYTSSSMHTYIGNWSPEIPIPPTSCHQSRNVKNMSSKCDDSSASHQHPERKIKIVHDNNPTKYLLVILKKIGFTPVPI